MPTQEQRFIENEDDESLEEEQSQSSIQRTKMNEVIELPYPLPDFELLSHSQISKSELRYEEYNTEYEDPEITEPEMNAFIPDFEFIQPQPISASETHLYTHLEDIERHPDVSLYTQAFMDFEFIKYEGSDRKHIELNTELEKELARDSRGGEKPLLEEILEVLQGSPYFPRGRSDIGNGPLAILIGEEKMPWHEPILYLLRELFREITETFPQIHFIKPGDVEDITEDVIDSTEPHYLEKFRFDNRIEFLDARDALYEVEEFFNALQNRFEAAYLQRFGLFVIAVKKRDMKEIKDNPQMKRMRVIALCPDDDNFKLFCKTIFGLDTYKNEHSETNFRNIMNSYIRALSNTVKNYSVFVRQGGIAPNDKEHEQYPYKVAIFEYLLKEDIKNNRGEETAKKKYFKNINKIVEYIQEMIFKDKRIKIEEPVDESQTVIPDITYKSGDKEIFIEFETLIGTLEPLKKIDHSIEKYVTLNGVSSKNSEIWIVLRPLSAIIHAKELKARLKIYKKIYSDKFTVNIKVLCRDGREWTLKDLIDFEKQIRTHIQKGENI